MIDEVARLQDALDIGNAVEVEKIKELILALQKKTLDCLEQ